MSELQTKHETHGSPAATVAACQPIKKCRVCGERALGFNFGGLSCESCKAFFRRVVFINTKELTCRNRNGQCEINMRTRRLCSACRFEKCLAIGMKTERLLRKRAPAGLQALKLLPLSPPLAPQLKLLSSFERRCLTEVATAAVHLGDEAEGPLEGQFETVIDCVNMTQIYVKKLVEFAKCFAAFRAIDFGDQLLVIKKNFLRLLFYRTSCNGDFERDGTLIFASEDRDFCKFAPYRLFDEVVGVVMGNQCRALTRTLQAELEGDKTLLHLVHIAFLFYPVAGIRGEYLTYYHFFYLRLLKRYLVDKYKSNERGVAKLNRLTALTAVIDEVSSIFMKALLKVIDVTQFNQLTEETYNVL